MIDKTLNEISSNSCEALKDVTNRLLISVSLMEITSDMTFVSRQPTESFSVIKLRRYFLMNLKILHFLNISNILLFIYYYLDSNNSVVKMNNSNFQYFSFLIFLIIIIKDKKIYI